ncbi:MAG: hypothetical protein J7L44_04045 [Candidatus Diapherotrites archaeon]|nr:hypothetical protein [Candidatus Diapherotrites archaeon]
MAGKLFEKKLLEFARRGNIERVRWLENINKHILPSHVKRILRKDKTVLQELVLPKWVTWDLLYDWALTQKKEKGRLCVLCDEYSEVGIEYNNKFICEYCFLKLKNLK